MSALPFFRPPLQTSSHFADNICTHEAEVCLPQTFCGIPSSVKFNGPLSWRAFDTVKLTIGHNAILEKIVDAARQARSLDCLMFGISLSFRQSFDVMFTGHGLVTVCQHKPEYSQDVDRLCDELSQLAVESTDAQYQLTLRWMGIYDRVTQGFDRLKNECIMSLQNLRYLMQDPLLLHYADVNAVFKEWWMERFDEVAKLDELLHNPEVIVPPTIRNVLSEISRQVPKGERVQIIANIDGAYQIVCDLATNAVLLADDGQPLAEVERRSSGNEVNLLFESLTLNTVSNGCPVNSV